MLSANNDLNRCVILIHGMWMNAFTMKFIGRQLHKKGWRVVYFNYSSMFKNFDENVKLLQELWKSNQSKNTHLVGHSLGGLLVLELIRKYQLENLPRTVLMGCPVNGSAVAKRMMNSYFGRAMLGKSACTLAEGVSEISLNKIGLIYGGTGFGIGHLIQSLPKPHDGVVASIEANIEFAEDAVTIPVTHASMLVSLKVANAIDRYLSSGKFDEKKQANTQN